MKREEYIAYYSENRRMECEDLERRLGVLVKNLVQFQKRAAHGKAAGCEEELTITTHYTRGFEQELQALTRNVEEIQRCTEMLKTLQKIK